MDTGSLFDGLADEPGQSRPGGKGGEKPRGFSPRKGAPNKAGEKPASFFAGRHPSEGPSRNASTPAHGESQTAPGADAGRAKRAVGGRPRSLDVQKKGVVCGLVAAGISRRQAARYVGCDHSTITNEERRDEQFARELRKAAVDAELGPMKSLYAAAGKHWRAAAWLLEHRQRERDMAIRRANERELQDQLSPENLLKEMETASESRTRPRKRVISLQDLLKEIEQANREPASSRRRTDPECPESSESQ